MGPESTDEVSVLEKKLRALAALIRYEQDFEKLRFYKREFDLVTAELRDRDSLTEKKNAKVLPFTRKNPLRSA